MGGLLNNRWGWKKTRDGNIMIRLLIKLDNEEHPHRIFIKHKETSSGMRIMLNAAELIFKDNKFSHSINSEPTWFNLEDFKQLVKALEQMYEKASKESKILSASNKDQ
jgi:hypothetical protein